MTKGDLLVCVEVMFLVVLTGGAFGQAECGHAKDRFGGKGSETADTTHMNVRLMLVLITQLAADDESQLRSMLNKQKFAEMPTDVEIRLLDFEELQRVFITD